MLNAFKEKYTELYQQYLNASSYRKLQFMEVKGMNETYTNGHEYFKDNVKNVAMQVYHGKL